MAYNPPARRVGLGRRRHVGRAITGGESGPAATPTAPMDEGYVSLLGNVGPAPARCPTAPHSLRDRLIRGGEHRAPAYLLPGPWRHPARHRPLAPVRR